MFVHHHRTTNPVLIRPVILVQCQYRYWCARSVKTTPQIALLDVFVVHKQTA